MLKRLKDRYERRNPVALVWMAFSDALGWVAGRLWPVKKVEKSGVIRKVLLVNPAHLGDVVISTAAIRLLKEANPEIHIGFVVGSWAKVVVEQHSGVDQVYVVDHWRLNRSNQPKIRKIWRYAQTWLKARRMIKDVGYDAGILLNSYAPNFASLLWFSRIPVRAGFVSAGLSTLLTDVLPKPQSIESEQAIQLKLLDRVGFNGISQGWLAVRQGAKVPLQLSDAAQPYVVLHPGTGNPAKSWLLDQWIMLAQDFSAKNMKVVVTGSGAAESQIAAEIESQVDCINLVGQLTWDEWLLTLSKASLVVGLDSAVGHICAALGRHFIGIYSGVGVVSRWAPQGTDIKVLTKPVPCSPCHTRPCKERPCITSISAVDVALASRQLL